MNKKIIIGIGICVILIITVLAIIYQAKDNKKQYKDAINIGVILNLTGALSQADTPKKKVLETALSYLKEQSTSTDPIQKINLVFEDGKTDPKSGLAAFRKLYNNGIRVYITGSSFNAMSLFPLTEENHCLLFAVSGHPDFGMDGKYSFRMYPRVQTGVSNMINALSKQNNPKIYIFHTNEPFGQSYASNLKKRYPYVIGEEPFQITQSDFKNSIAKLKSSGAERVVIIGFGLGERNLLKDMFEQRLLIPVLGSEVFYYAALDLPNFSNIEGAKNFFQSTVFLGPTLLDSILSQSGDDFVKYYQNKTGEKAPQLFGIFAADSLMILRKSLIEAGGNRSIDAINDALSFIKDINGFSGNAALLKSRELEYDLKYYGLDKNGNAYSLKQYLQ